MKEELIEKIDRLENDKKNLYILLFYNLIVTLSQEQNNWKKLNFLFINQKDLFEYHKYCV